MFRHENNTNTKSNSDLLHNKPDHQEKNLIHCNEIMVLKELKLNHYRNPLLAHLNINGLTYKIIDLRELLDGVDIDIISVSKRKLDDFFLSVQFHTDSYFLFRRDINKHGGSLAAFVKCGLLPKRIKETESDKIKILALEINISERKWIIFSTYTLIDGKNQMLITLWKKYPRY